MTVELPEDLRVDMVPIGGGGTLVLVAGEVDPRTASQLAEPLRVAMEAGGEVVVDLSGVTFFDSSGIAVLIATHQALRSNDRGLVVRAPSRVVERVLQLAQLTGEFTIE